MVAQVLKHAEATLAAGLFSIVVLHVVLIIYSMELEYVCNEFLQFLPMQVKFYAATNTYSSFYEQMASQDKRQMDIKCSF